MKVPSESPCRHSTAQARLHKLMQADSNWLRSDSVSHTKATLVGSSVTIPITDGRLNLGTWQGEFRLPLARLVQCDNALMHSSAIGIYLTEFRHHPHTRSIVATIT